MIVGFEIVVGPELERALAREVAPIMERDLRAIKVNIEEGFGGHRSGREYSISRGVRYRASAPGERPAVRTGVLRASVGEPHVGREGSALVGRLEIKAPYAGYLERGTSRMARRPFVRPSVEEILRRLR